MHRSQLFFLCLNFFPFVTDELFQTLLCFLQLANRQQIFAMREEIWMRYHAGLRPLQDEGKLMLPHIPAQCTHNSHLFYIRITEKRYFDRLASLSKTRKVGIFTHYVPLHLSSGGLRYGRASGDLDETVTCNSQLCRLPIWPGLQQSQVDRVITLVFEALQ